MEYTIRDMIARKGRRLEDTDYAASNQSMLDFRLFSGDFYEWIGGKLRFKDSAEVMDFDQAAKAFPPFGEIRYASRELFPYFTDNLDALMEAQAQGESIAVEGGPCLFGEYEVTVSVELDSGESHLFDYANGKAYLGETGFEETMGLAEFLRLNGDRVKRISFQQHKWELTPQEYLGLRYPFQIAAALDGPLVIPIPDMSYRKYLLYSLDAVSEDIRNQALEEFDGILDRISDIYLRIIGDLQARFQIKQFACVHRRDPASLGMWYEKRTDYIERKKILRNLTRLPEKIEPIKDYISMPALPFYLFGSNRILEVNSVDETDSYRKCKKAHKRVAQMGCILYPELLSGDGVRTYYHTTLQWKEYGVGAEDWTADRRMTLDASLLSGGGVSFVGNKIAPRQSILSVMDCPTPPLSRL